MCLADVLTVLTVSRPLFQPMPTPEHNYTFKSNDALKDKGLECARKSKQVLNRCTQTRSNRDTVTEGQVGQHGKRCTEAAIACQTNSNDQKRDTPTVGMCKSQRGCTALWLVPGLDLSAGGGREFNGSNREVRLHNAQLPIG